MKQIEIEFRALLEPQRYDDLLSFLNEHGEDLGVDDKDVFFFIYPDKLLKVVNNISKNNAKLVLKLNKIGEGSDFEEIEIPFSPDEFQKAVSMFRVIGSKEVQNSYQKRHNFMYKGVEFAVKYTDTWGFHVELEVLISDQKDKQSAEARIYEVADELGIKIMSDEELRAFTKSIDAGYKAGKYQTGRESAV